MEVGGRDIRSRSTLAQINVTPFVDVMLVLLIIFMVTAPMLDRGIKVNLPEVRKVSSLAGAKEPLIITVAHNGAIAIGHTRVQSPAKLTPVLGQILRERQDKDVFLEADKSVAYGRVVQVMAAIREAGVTKLGMVAVPPKR